MISPEVAKATVESAERKESKAKAQARLDALPEGLAAIARGLAEGISEYGAPDPAPFFERLEALPESDRVQVFEAMMPGFGQDVSCGWNGLPGRSLGQLSCASPFRASPGSARYRQARRNWLRVLCHVIRRYDRETEWLAEWCGHLDLCYGLSGVAPLFAAVIERGGERGERIYGILLDTVLGRQERAVVNQAAVGTLLMLDRPEGWEAVEKLLLAAQRQEGMRAMVLDALDGACPGALVRMLRLIESERLYRFAAVSARFVTWFRLGPGELAEAEARRWMSAVVRAMESPEARRAALQGEAPSPAFFALWMEACEDLDAAISQAVALRSRTEAEWRFTAVWFLRQVAETEALIKVAGFLGDPDARVAALAWRALNERYYDFSSEHAAPEDVRRVFDQAKRFVRQLPPMLRLSACVWGGTEDELERKECANQLARFWVALPFAEIQPFLEWMSTEGRVHVLQGLRERAKQHGLNQAEREFVVAATGDAGSAARSLAHDLLRELKLAPGDAVVLEEFLKRKSSASRQAILILLLTQERDAVRESIARLEGSRNGAQRAAAEELKEALARREGDVAGTGELPAGTGAGATAMLAASASDALRSEAIEPALPAEEMDALVSRAACQQLRAALDALFAENAKREVTYEAGNESRTELLGNLSGGFPAPLPDVPFDNQRNRLPVREVWEEFWSDWRSAHPDGVRAALTMQNLLFGEPGDGSGEDTPSRDQHVADRSLLRFLVWLPDWDWRTNGALQSLLHWFHLMTPPEEVAKLLARFCEATVQGCMEELPALNEFLRTPPPKTQWMDPRMEFRSRVSTWFDRAAESLHASPDAWPDAMLGRVWGLARRLEESLPSGEFRPPFLIAAAAYERGLATDADLHALLLQGGGNATGMGQTYFAGSALAIFTQESRRELKQRYARTSAFIAQVRELLLDAEMSRGDLNTPTSGLCLNLRCVWGAARVMDILAALGQEKLTRGYLFGIDRSSVLSHLVRVSRPLAGDTADRLRQAASARGVAPAKLRDLAVYAPQWSRLVEEALGEPGLEDACWWLHAHTKDTQWSLPEELKQDWRTSVQERTPLTPLLLTLGAVDTEWFRRVIERLGRERWTGLLASAKYASGGAGHKRAELFGNAFLGEATPDAIEDRIDVSRSQDHVRALGLLPLPEGRTAARAELARRYGRLQQFAAQSKQFGAQKQASEKLAVEVGLENLARNAGYTDPRRFSWAMEAERMQDLRDGKLVVAVDDVTLALQLAEDGGPEIEARRGERLLKEIPTALRKREEVTALRSRAKELLQQLRQMRESLERAMVDGDLFGPDDWRELRSHPLLCRLFDSLVWCGEDGRMLAPEEAGSQPVRVAHPLDLLESGEWPKWQRWCLERERKQPFKQAFREVYPLTAAEREAKWASSRYAGQEVHPRQGAALLGRRGWVTGGDEGMHITFFRQRLTAHLGFLEGAFTPLELDGLTVKDVWFTPAGEEQPLALNEVPARLFSEVMRDADLLVSVAHRGNVDPEASQSTIEMRAALVAETAWLMKLGNVRIDGRYVFVNGSLGDFNIHLGSGGVHRHPGGALCILPASSQHRGRLFLPFADDDPKTAEIVSKTVLLARDGEIQDPVILAQIRAAV